MEKRTKELHDLMARHNLRAPDVAKLVNRKAGTVRIWRCGGERQIPAHTLELLKLKLRTK